MEKNSFILYKDQQEIIDKLSDENAGKLIKAIYQYANTGEIPELNELLSIAIIPFEQSIDRNSEKWEETKEKRRKAGKISAEKKKQISTNQTHVESVEQTSTNSTHVESVEQTSTNSTVNVSVSDNVSVSVNDNDNVNVNSLYIIDETNAQKELENKSCEYLTKNGTYCSKKAKLGINGKFYCGQHSRIELKKYGVEFEVNSDNNKERKCKYGKFGRVKLTDDEYSRLINEFGEDFIKKQIELLDEYVESNNNKNKYTNFNLVLRRSIREKWFERKPIVEEPKWFNKENKSEEASVEEQLELEKILGDMTE